MDKFRNEKEETDAPTDSAIVDIEHIAGVVCDCDILRIRKEPNSMATVIAKIPRDAAVKINMNRSTNEWYQVTTKNNHVGFCMRRYVALNQ